MDTATVLIIAIAVLTLAITLMAIYTAMGPGSQNLDDPFLNHTHGPNGHSHGNFHAHGHSHTHSHGHNVSRSG